MSASQADFAATLVDEWTRAGVRDAVVSPGSRSSPLAIALLHEPMIRCHVRLDERSGAFFAIGCALGSGRPTVVLTTSGTAAAEVHAAVIEADLAGVPLVVCTADRPPELQGVGAPQTVAQSGLFGGAVRCYLEPGVPDEAQRHTWRSLGSRMVAESLSGPRGPGPVHVNLAFREPLGGERGTPAATAHPSVDRAPAHRLVRGRAAGHDAEEVLRAAVEGVARGVIVVGRAGSADPAGPGSDGLEDAVYSLAQHLGWPVLADPRAWPRRPHDVLVATADGVLRSAAASEALRPDVVLHIGAPHASKVVSRWNASTAAGGARHILVDPFGWWQDPERSSSLVVAADPVVLARAVSRAGSGGDGGDGGDGGSRGGSDGSHGSSLAPAIDGSTWLGTWQRAERAAQRAIDDVLGASGTLSEPAVARWLVAMLPDDATLVTSSSMPIRDVEWYAAPRCGAPRVLANRGANGIDGVTSTVLGVAAGSRGQSGGTVVGLLGDLAFLHDVSGLVWGVAEERPDATLVVVDNAGGGIFSFLPYATTLDDASFERAFATPQAADVGAVAAGFGCAVHPVTSRAGLGEALSRAVGARGIDVILVRTDRRANVALHAELERAIVDAVDVALEAG